MRRSSDKATNSHIERTVYVQPDVTPGSSLRYGDWVEDKGGYFPFPSYVPLTIIEAATGSDYSGNLVEISNARSLKRDFPWLVEVHGGYGTQGVAYLGKRENQNDRLIEAIDGLTEYPIYDEQDHSDLEFETAAEQWSESYGGRHEFKRALVEFFDEILDEGYIHDLADDVHNDAIDNLWYDACELLHGGESYLNESGSSIYFPINRVIDYFRDARFADQLDRGPYYGERGTLREQINALCEASRTSAVDSEAMLVHLLKTRGGNECGVDGAHSSDINFVTCSECIALHDSVVIRDSESDE